MRIHDDFAGWLENKYGAVSPVKVNRGKVHDYLGMTFDYSVPGKVIANMRDYVKGMLEEFPIQFTPDETMPTPASDQLLSPSTGDLLGQARKDDFHTFDAKGLFLCKRARPDIHPAIAILCSRVKSPTVSDWEKLVHLMKYLNGTREDVLTLSVDSLTRVMWWVDASFAVHPDMRSHTGAVMSMGDSAIISMSKKQKLNTRSSTEAELVGVDDAMNLILWMKLFLKEQGYDITSALHGLQA